MILTANIGSASRKYALFDGTKEILRAHFELDNPDYKKANEVFIKKAKNYGEIYAVGIRVVAPGAYFQEHKKITDEFLAKLTKAQEFAPLHITSTLKEIHELRALLPNIPFYCASDSAFHKTLPAVASTYALPAELVEKFELHRFGYHGLSLESVVKQLSEKSKKLPEKIVVCHLGSGSSITALKNGKSVDTSMGFSPLEGLVMATRSGSVDPSVILLLAEKSGLTPSELEKKLNTESGLLAVGGSNDIRELLKMGKNGNANAKLALDLFAYRVRQYIGSYSATLGGIDALVFTGTIGERSEPMRERILQGLDFLHIQGRIYVLPADEESVIAQAVIISF